MLGPAIRSMSGHGTVMSDNGVDVVGNLEVLDVGDICVHQADANGDSPPKRDVARDGFPQWGPIV